MIEEKTSYCSRCILDSKTPNILFDSESVCNYCKFFDKLSLLYPRGEKGINDFDKLIKKIKKKGKNKKYNCIIGVSGGTDSTYLLYIAVKKYGLRPLAVTIDNGWNTEIAVNNLKKSLDILGVDLLTYVINWEEVKEVHLAFLRASLPWPDGSSDEAINAALYKIAKNEKIKYILNGHDFRTEGKQPLDWTYTDGKLIHYIVKKFSHIKLKSFPYLTLFKYIYYVHIKNIKNIRPFWYINYSKIEAIEFLKKELNWVYYGGHHHENIFTRFIIGCWLPEKFGIDKRKITYSAHVRTGEMTRENALNKIKQLPYAKIEIEKDKQYIIKKLGITEKEFEDIWNQPNKNFYDYPSYYPIYKKFRKLYSFITTYILHEKPMISEIN